MSDNRPPDVVEFDIPKRERLRAAFNEARKGREDTPFNLESFTFEGRVFLVGYAKYVLEYLDEKLGPA